MKFFDDDKCPNCGWSVERELRVEVGDIVGLDTESPVPMTVEGYDASHVECVWFEREGSNWTGPHRCAFPYGYLKVLASRRDRDR